LRKVILIAGTRPEAIKLVPVYFALKKQTHFETILVSTGQHREMIAQIFSFFNIRPEIELNIMQPNQTLGGLTSLLFLKIEELVTTLKPSWVVVQGDTTSAMVASLISFYHKVPVAHVEAGLRSHNRFAPFPEEVNRSIISLVSALHFVPTEAAARNLERKVEGEIIRVGNTVVDSLLLTVKKINENPFPYHERFRPFLLPEKKLILVTAHRRESFENGLDNICQAILEISQEHQDLYFILPLHLNPNVRQIVNSRLSGQSAIFLVDPLSYDDMVFFMSKAFIVLTDSGGIQEEAPSLNVPVLVLRDVTERQEGIEAGCALLAGTEKSQIVNVFKTVFPPSTLYANMKKAGNPYGDGNAADRIASVLAARL
jgi:UDP-N-acetylglucosamine 2-epimerase (non-hydrolysing)